MKTAVAGLDQSAMRVLGPLSGAPVNWEVVKITPGERAVDCEAQPAAARARRVNAKTMDLDRTRVKGSDGGERVKSILFQFETTVHMQESEQFSCDGAEARRRFWPGVRWTWGQRKTSSWPGFVPSERLLRNNSTAGQLE